MNTARQLSVGRPITGWHFHIGPSIRVSSIKSTRNKVVSGTDQATSGLSLPSRWKKNLFRDAPRPTPISKGCELGLPTQTPSTFYVSDSSPYSILVFLVSAGRELLSPSRSQNMLLCALFGGYHTSYDSSTYYTSYRPYTLQLDARL